MTRPRLTSKDGIAAGWREAPDGARVPVRHAGSSSSPISREDDTAAPSAPRAGWLRAGLRIARNALVGMLLLVSVPVVVVGIADARDVSRGLLRVNTVLGERMAEVERLRVLMAPRDPGITPMQAGLAFRALQMGRQNDGLVASPDADATFPMRDVPTHGERSWRSVTITPSMFPGLMGMGYSGPMPSRIIAATQGKLSGDELAYLRTVAESPVWADFDRVGSARSVDLLGGQFVLPFRADAVAYTMPTMRYADSKELAYAGVSRAAFYVATGQTERAERSLKSIVSFGFAMIDNGSTLLDALIGRTIVDIGRDGLHQLYVLTNDAEGLQRAARLSSRSQVARRSVPFDADAAWARLLADATNPQAPRTLRLESLRQLSMGTCGTVRGMLFGMSPEVNAAFDAASGTLVRYPSDQAYLDLVRDQPNRLPEQATPRGAGERLLFGAATVAGIVLDNPRVPACTRLVQLID